MIKQGVVPLYVTAHTIYIDDVKGYDEKYVMLFDCLFDSQAR